MMITMAITVAVSVVNGPYINTIVDDDGAAFTIDADSSLLLDKLSASFSVDNQDEDNAAAVAIETAIKTATDVTRMGMIILRLLCERQPSLLLVIVVYNMKLLLMRQG